MEDVQYILISNCIKFVDVFHHLANHLFYTGNIFLLAQHFNNIISGYNTKLWEQRLYNLQMRIIYPIKSYGIYVVNDDMFFYQTIMMFYNNYYTAKLV